MPWKETDKMEQKELFIKAMLANEKPFKHLCADFGISEKTGHKWKNRFYEQGKAGLYEQSRARLTQDMIDGDTAAELIRIKNAHLAWGPKKIREIYAKAYPQKDVPSLSSAKRILDKAGLVKPRKIRPPVCSDCPRLQQQIQAQAANDVWSIDFKGWWKSDGEICEPFTVRDRYSRKILCTKLMQSKSSVAVRAVMTDLFKTYGLPKVIHSDNGAPFAAPNGILNRCLVDHVRHPAGSFFERASRAERIFGANAQRYCRRDRGESARRDFGESGCARRMGKGIQLCQTE